MTDDYIKASKALHQKDLRSLENIYKNISNTNEKDYNGYTLLDNAILDKFEQGAIFLIENGILLDNITQKGEHTIHLAVKLGMCECVKKILALEPNLVNVKDQYGNNPLWIALFEARLNPDVYFPIVEILLKNGADAKNTNNSGRTPLYILEIATETVREKIYKLNEKYEFINWSYEIVTQDVLDNVEKAKQPLVKIYHYHCNHLGTPQELSDDKGDIVWLSYDRAWGGSFDTIYKQQFIDNWAINESELQPFKFQGQSLDVETGLHYNRFRYYDSDVGMFISRDPIGLLGGNNVFQYAPNPVMWIDPWGLANIKLRHYTSNQGFAGIKESMTIKGGDQNAVFATKAKGKPLSMADAADKFKIKQSHARNYIDFEIDEARVEHRVNDLGVEEYKIKGDVKLDEETTKFNKRTKC